MPDQKPAQPAPAKQETLLPDQKGAQPGECADPKCMCHYAAQGKKLPPVSERGRPSLRPSWEQVRAGEAGVMQPAKR